MSSQTQEYSFGRRFYVLFEIDQLPGIDWGSEPEHDAPARHGYLAHVVGTEDVGAVDFSAEELTRGQRLAPSLHVGCGIGEKIRMPIEIREPISPDGREFDVVVVGVPVPFAHALTTEELAAAEPIAA